MALGVPVVRAFMRARGEYSRRGGVIVIPGVLRGYTHARGVVPGLPLMAVHRSGVRSRSAVLVPAFTRWAGGVVVLVRRVLVPARSFTFGVLTHARARTRSACVHCAGVLTVYPWGRTF